jgi:cobalamin biosynthesis protein CobD/CbiB
LSLDLYDVWYFVMGFLMANGVPHFVFGRAGKIFRSPFGQRSPPKTNVAWGAANFALATVIGLALAYLGLYDSYSIVLLLLGFWLMVLNFGLSIKRFLND